MFEHAGYRVLTAGNGEEAFGHADREVGEDLRGLASTFLAKPFGPQDLIRIVKETISG